MMRFLILVVLTSLHICANAQYPAAVYQLEKQQMQNDSLEGVLSEKIEVEKCKYWMQRLSSEMLPAGVSINEVVQHRLMLLQYSEAHEQALWVAHVIAPEVGRGMHGRSNDFRPDPLVKTGTCTDRDYFIRDTLSDGKIKYDGFGYDRGHLAPSADFRWSATALSESFFYSNMSPQKPEFNRDSWAKLEDRFRFYVESTQRALFVFTGPLLRDNLPKMERSENKPSIPVYYYKIGYDPQKEFMAAFLMPNKRCEQAFDAYSITVDSLEALTGIDFFSSLPDALENRLEGMIDVKPFLNLREQADVKALEATELPRNHFNTAQAKYYSGKNEEITVCGTVVSTKKSSKGNVFLNLDKSFPNQVFTVSIFKDRLIHFSYAPEEYWSGKTVCVTGKVSDFNGVPSMMLENENAIRLYEDDEP
jgi:endonuclease G